MRRDRQRRRVELAARFGIPDPFDLAVWVRNLARRRGRPIRFIGVDSDEMLQLTGDPGVHAFVLDEGGVDYIYYKSDLPYFLVEHNILHELAHLAYDHPIPQLAGRWDPARVAQLCKASRMDAPALRRFEDEAESLALWVEDLRGDDRGLPPSTDPALAELFGRVGAFFGDR